MITYQLGTPTRSVYPVDGVEYDAIPVAFLVDGSEHAAALYCLRPGTALATVEDVEERARYEVERIEAEFAALEAAGAVAGTFDGVSVFELAQLRSSG